MNVLKVSVIDMLKIKYQIFLIVLFTVISYYFMTNDQTFLSILYMHFGTIIFSTQPFLLEQASESGFLNLLPFSQQERVMGRFTFGLLLVILADVLSILTAAVYSINHGMLPAEWYASLVLLTGAALIILVLQYTLFFAIGKFKSQQAAGIIMMLPGFLLFFGGGFLVDHLGERLPEVLQWAAENFNLLGIICLLAGLIIWICGIMVSCLFVRKKDKN